MDYNVVVSIIVKAAKTAKVSSALLLAICSHESNNFKMNYSHNDHGSPSYGICQLKEASARQLGFIGKKEELMNPRINARYAAAYLKYEQNRYGENDWVKLVSSYNSGSYMESKVVPGCPKNLRYVKKVQKFLDVENRSRLDCGSMWPKNE